MPTLDEVRAAYAQTGSMRAAGKRLGISGQRVHQILTADGYEPPLTPNERLILEAIVGLSTPVLRGPNTNQLAEKLGMKKRALQYRRARLRRLNLVYIDNDHGYLPTAEARPKL